MMCYLPFQASAHVLNTERKNADIVVNYVYQKAHLKNQINYNVFKQAFIAYNKTKGEEKVTVNDH